MAGKTDVKRHAHPGRGGKAMAHPKGRQLDPQASNDIGALLGDGPRDRDLLIEYLHLIQDKYGCLAAKHLVALADEMRMAMTEIYEVATFYAHFDVITDEADRPPPITIRVCDSVTCEMMGSEALIDALARDSGAEIRVLRAPCMGACDKAPAVAIGHAQFAPATADGLQATLQSGHRPTRPDYRDYDAYVADGGYALLRDCLDGKRTPDDLTKILDDSGLRGLRRRGISSGEKMEFRACRSRPPG